MAQPRLPPLGIGLIGLGRHGSRYAQHILNDLPEARLVAVSRRRPTESSGLPSGLAIPCYADYHDLIVDPHVEAVVVVAPPALNRGICLAVASARKALLVEKPLATTAADARLIARAARDCGQVMMTAQTLRFDAAVAALKERQAAVGALQYLSLASRMEPHGLSEDARGFDGRGCLLEIGIHLLDLIRVLTNDEVVTVSCDMDSAPPPGSRTSHDRAICHHPRLGGIGRCVTNFVRKNGPHRTHWNGGAVVGRLVRQKDCAAFSATWERGMADRGGSNRPEDASRLCPVSA